MHAEAMCLAMIKEPREPIPLDKIEHSCWLIIHQVESIALSCSQLWHAYMQAGKHIQRWRTADAVCIWQGTGVKLAGSILQYITTYIYIYIYAAIKCMGVLHTWPGCVK